MPKSNLHLRKIKNREFAKDDTVVSAAMLTKAVNSILRKVKLNRTYDIPYLAGYSRSGKIIYIDRHLPKSFISNRKRIFVDQYLILHESVEKALIDELGLLYQYAHQVALRAEEAAVLSAGISWRKYDSFMQRHIKEADDEKLERIPIDLDIKPYYDEHDKVILKSMQEVLKKELAARRHKKRRS